MADLCRWTVIGPLWAGNRRGAELPPASHFAARQQRPVRRSGRPSRHAL